jgi:hypothetical protein
MRLGGVLNRGSSRRRAARRRKKLRRENAELKARAATGVPAEKEKGPNQAENNPVTTALKKGQLAVGMTQEQVLKVFAMNQRNYGGGPIAYSVTKREISSGGGPVLIEKWESSWYYPGLFSSLEFRNGIVDSIEVH